MQDKAKVKEKVFICLGGTGVFFWNQNNMSDRLHHDTSLAYSEPADYHVNGTIHLAAVHENTLFGILSSSEYGP